MFLEFCSTNKSLRVTLDCKLEQKKVGSEAKEKHMLSLAGEHLAVFISPVLSHCGHLPNPGEFHRAWVPKPSQGSLICAPGEGDKSQSVGKATSDFPSIYQCHSLGFPFGFSWDWEVGSLQKWFTDGFVLLINTRRHLYSPVEAKIILGNHPGFFPQIFLSHE